MTEKEGARGNLVEGGVKRNERLAGVAGDTENKFGFSSENLTFEFDAPRWVDFSKDSYRKKTMKLVSFWNSDNKSSSSSEGVASILRSPDGKHNRPCARSFITRRLLSPQKPDQSHYASSLQNSPRMTDYRSCLEITAFSDNDSTAVTDSFVDDWFEVEHSNHDLQISFEPFLLSPIGPQEDSYVDLSTHSPLVASSQHLVEDLSFIEPEALLSHNNTHLNIDEYFSHDPSSTMNSTTMLSKLDHSLISRVTTPIVSQVSTPKSAAAAALKSPVQWPHTIGSLPSASFEALPPRSPLNIVGSTCSQASSISNLLPQNETLPVDEEFSKLEEDLLGLIEAHNSKIAKTRK